MLHLLLIYILFFLSSAVSAEVYKWEDAESMHFTDDPSSVPKEYHDNVYAETRDQIKNTTPQARVGIAQQNRQIVNQLNMSMGYQDNSVQKKRAEVRSIQKHTSALTVGANNVANSFPSLASLIVAWLMIVLFLIITWIVTIIDTVRSRFITPAIKIAWILLVIFIPLIGMELYYILGVSQKSNLKSYNEKQRSESIARINPRESKGKNFIIS